MLVDSAHCNAGEYSVGVYQLVDGRYVEVDQCHVCLFDGDVTEARPPFSASCDENEPCQLSCG